MAGGIWTLNARGAAGSVATASQTAPSDATPSGMQLRLCALQCSMAGSGGGSDLLVVRDGASGAGTVIFSMDLSIGANGTGLVAVSGLDLRASPGNALTVEFVSGLALARENINAQGDLVPRGYPLGMR